MSQPGTNLQLNLARHHQILPGGEEKKPLDQAGGEIQEPFQQHPDHPHPLHVMPLDAQLFAHPTSHHTPAGAQTN